MTTEDMRVTALEETVAHQGRTIEELSQQIADQWTVIDQMRTQLIRLSEHFLTLQDSSLEAPPITRPPHY